MLPSLQGVLSGAVGFEHAPVVASHVPATWHASRGWQVIGSLPAQAPSLQRSIWVQLLPSSQTVSSGAMGLEHSPVVVSQVPAVWHESRASHTTGLLPTHSCDWH